MRGPRRRRPRGPPSRRAGERHPRHGLRGSRAGRFTHWLHTHPNAPAIPSGPDADAAQETSGIDMILGLRFSPEGPLPWFDDVEGTRRTLKATTEKKPRKRSFFARHALPILGRAQADMRFMKSNSSVFTSQALESTSSSLTSKAIHMDGMQPRLNWSLEHRPRLRAGLPDGQDSRRGHPRRGGKQSRWR